MFRRSSARSVAQGCVQATGGRSFRHEEEGVANIPLNGCIVAVRGSTTVEPASQSLTSVSRALRLLLMLQTSEALRVVDVARELGVAGSTAHRLLACLRDEGFLRQKEGSRTYTPGPEVLRLARTLSDQHTLENIARPHLQRLCSEVNETVNLQILVGPEVLCIDSVVEDRHELHVRQITGQRTPATLSAAGKALLALYPPAQLREVLSTNDDRTTGSSPRELAELERELALIRSRGYAVNMGQRESGVHAVAVPILDGERHQVGALSVAAPSVRLPANRVAGLVKRLRSSSAAITADYAFRSPA